MASSKEKTKYLKSGKDAYNRIRNHLDDLIIAEHGTLFNEDRNLNRLDDPFLADVQKLAVLYHQALATVEVIAMGAFTSCDHQPQYAGGVVSEGNRIFTPQQGAINGLETIKKLSAAK